MKPLLLLVVYLSGLYAGIQAQNTDFPGPTANLQSLPSGSYVISMDNTDFTVSSDQIKRALNAPATSRIHASAFGSRITACRIQHFTLSSKFFKILYDNRIK